MLKRSSCVVCRKIFLMDGVLRNFRDTGDSHVCLSDFQRCLQLDTLKTQLTMTNKEERPTGNACVLIIWLPHRAEDARIKTLFPIVLGAAPQTVMLLSPLITQAPSRAGHSSHAQDILVLPITNRAGYSLCICWSSQPCLWSCGGWDAQPGSQCATPQAPHSLLSWYWEQRPLSYPLLMELAEQYES